MKILDSEICDHHIDNDILKLWPFDLSPFQKNAIAGLLNNKHVLVSAHTGSGKHFQLSLLSNILLQKANV